MKFLIFIMLLMSFNFAKAQLGGVEIPDCEIDQISERQYARAESIVEQTIETIKNKPDVETTACLPAMQNIGKKISASIPSFSAGDLIDSFKKSACRAANSALNSVLRDIDMSINAPYGLANVTVGGTGDANWKSWKEPEFSKSDDNALKFLNDVASSLGRSFGESITSPLGNVKDATNTFEGQIQRDTRGTTRQIRRGIENAINE